MSPDDLMKALIVGASIVSLTLIQWSVSAYRHRKDPK